MKEDFGYYLFDQYRKILKSILIINLILVFCSCSQYNTYYKTGRFDIRLKNINSFYYKKGIINIAYCSTTNQITDIAYSSISIIKQTDCNLNFYIFAPKSIEKVGSVFEKLEIEYEGQVHFFYDIIDFELCNLTFQNHWNFWSSYCFARIFMINSINVSKCIYIDTDVYGCDNIAELWNVDLGDNLIAGVPDALPNYDFIDLNHLKLLNKLIELNEFDSKNKITLTRKNYLNSGVLLMNILELKKYGFVKKAAESWKRNKTFYLDQDLFNILVGNRRIVLDWKFNKKFSYICNECVLRHYNHIKVPNPSVKRNLYDYEFYFNAVDEYDRLISKWNKNIH